MDEIPKKWPERCCVAAFVWAAILNLCCVSVDRQQLARRLGIRVGPNDDNPWGLPVAKSGTTGLTVAEATEAIPLIVCEYRLFFRHVPFNTIAFEQFPETLHHAVSRRHVAGVGLDYSVVSGRGRQHSAHVMRCRLGETGRCVVLVDDSTGFPAVCHELQWHELEAAVHAVDGGYWIIGN